MNTPLELLTKDPALLEVLKLKSRLMILVTSNIRNNGYTQKHVAGMLSVSQPQLFYLLNGQMSKFSIDTLIVFAFKLGLRVETNIKTDKKGKHTLISKIK